MKREIKFRGKTEEGRWAYGDFSLINSYEKPLIFEDLFDEFLVILETVGQLTGLKDKNGKDIYEGDILQINIYSCVVNKIIASGKSAVEYRGCTFGVEWGFSLEFTGLDAFSNNCSFEVIGNVHDHPELLEVTEA